MRALGTIALVVMAGCGFQVRGSAPDDGPPGGDDAAPPRDTADAPIDAPIDAMIDAPIDGPPLAACPAAPAGCVQFTCSPTSCHYVCSDKRGWVSARDKCVTLGLGCLTTIDDTTENTCIATATTPVFAAGSFVWIGWVQAAGASEPAGGWGWQCGTSGFVAPNWGAFEPNNSGGNEDCALMIEGAAWIDGACNTSARYVCEFPR